MLNGVPLAELPDSVLEAERAELEMWCTPEDFRKKVDALAGHFSLEERFNSPRLVFLHDAILLAEFASKLDGVTSVRLATKFDRFPDGYIETTQDDKSLKVQIEVTEADHEDRRRGDEYKDGGKAEERATDYSEGVNVISKELERVIQKKADKRYRPKPTLVVWLNLDKAEIKEDDVRSVLDDARRRHAASFENIYLLWREKVFGPPLWLVENAIGSTAPVGHAAALLLFFLRLDPNRHPQSLATRPTVK